MNSREGQSQLNRRMDDTNNGAAINGPDFKTFEELQRWARSKITEVVPFNGDGLEGRVMWHRKPARGWQPDWSKVPLLSIEGRAPLGAETGVEHAGRDRGGQSLRPGAGSLGR
jgi:hypothetical protein